MVKIILIIAYVIVFGASAVIFLLYGRKKGWRGGATVMISSAVAFIASCFLANVLALELFGIQPVMQLIKDIVGSAAEKGLDSAVFLSILFDSTRRILAIPSAIVLYILFFIVAFVLTRTVMRFIKPKKPEIEKKSKIIGAALGAAAPVIVAVLAIFVPKVNLFQEAGSIDSILALISKPANEIVMQICSDPDSYTKILFETTLTEADEAKRLELINKSLKAIVLNTKDELLIECFDFEGYSSRSEFEDDIVALAELYQAFDGTDLLSGGDFSQKMFSVADKDGMAQNLYQLSFKDCIVRYAISYTAHDLTNSGSFVCPKTQMPGTYEDFALLVTTTEKYENGEISLLDMFVELKDSPLLPTELYAEMLFTL